MLYRAIVSVEPFNDFGFSASSKTSASVHFLRNSSHFFRSLSLAFWAVSVCNAFFATAWSALLFGGTWSSMFERWYGGWLLMVGMVAEEVEAEWWTMTKLEIGGAHHFHWKRLWLELHKASTNETYAPICTAPGTPAKKRTIPHSTFPPSYLRGSPQLRTWGHFESRQDGILLIKTLRTQNIGGLSPQISTNFHKFPQFTQFP